MFAAKLVEENLGVLLSLRNPATLEELAGRLGTKEGHLATPLRMLQEQNIVEKSGDQYRLLASPALESLLSTVLPWVEHVETQYYEIAKDVAQTILEKSWLQVGVQDVLLFGSTLRGRDTPSDIDLLILHAGCSLAEFEYDPYGKRKEWEARSDVPARKGNNRSGAASILRDLGFRGNPADNYLTEDFERELPYRRDSVFNNVLRRVEPLGFPGPSSIWEFQDSEKFSSLFDLHVMSSNLFGRDEYAGQLRAAAVCSCRDPTFWHTVFTEGRLYDRSTHDFSLSVEMKYPGVPELFKP